jgi:hypothetical protein
MMIVEDRKSEKRIEERKEDIITIVMRLCASFFSHKRGVVVNGAQNNQLSPILHLTMLEDFSLVLDAWFHYQELPVFDCGSMEDNHQLLMIVRRLLEFG